LLYTLIEIIAYRVEQLLPLVDDNTPLNDPNSIELELLSNMVADYSEEYFSLGIPSLTFQIFSTNCPTMPN
jgi:HTH-type transcriptional regulator/antitoxin HigA